MTKYTLILAILAPCMALAQINIDTIPKKVNVIEINTGLSMEENFVLAGQVIAEKGWAIEQMHKDIGQIVTGNIKGDKLDTFNKFIILAKNQKIRISGQFTFQNLKVAGLNLPDTSTGIITNYGMKGSVTKKAFEAMLGLAEKIAPSGSKITFLIDK